MKDCHHLYLNIILTLLLGSFNPSISPASDNRSNLYKENLLNQIQNKMAQLPTPLDSNNQIVFEDLRSAKRVLKLHDDLPNAEILYQRALEFLTLQSIIAGLPEIFSWDKKNLTITPSSTTQFTSKIQMALTPLTFQATQILLPAYQSKTETYQHRELLRDISMRFVMLYQTIETLKLLSSIDAESSIPTSIKPLLDKTKSKFLEAIEMSKPLKDYRLSPLISLDSEPLLTPETKSLIQEAQESLKKASTLIFQNQKIMTTSDLYLRIEALERLRPDLNSFFHSPKAGFTTAIQNHLSFNFSDGDKTFSESLQTLTRPLIEKELDPNLAGHFLRAFTLLSYFQKYAEKFSLEQSESISERFETLRNSKTTEEYVLLAKEFETLTLNLLQNNGELDSDLLLSVAPDIAKNILLTFFQRVRACLPEIRDTLQNKLTTLETLQFHKNQDLNQALYIFENAIDQFIIDIKQTTNLDFISSVFRSKKLLLTLITTVFDSLMSRTDSALPMVKLFQDRLSELRTAPDHKINLKDSRLFSLLNQERNELALRPWFNKEMARTLTASVSLSALLTLPLTAGGSSVILGAANYLLSEVLIASTTGLVTLSSLNIVDRYRFDGLGGLFTNPDTALDLLTILSLSPRPIAVVPPSTLTLSGKAWQHTKNIIAKTQFLTGNLSSYLLGGYGCYLLYNAENISKDLAQNGIHLSVHEIRAKAALQLALSFLAQRNNLHYLETGKAKFQNNFLSALDKDGSRWQLFKKDMSNYNPYWAYKSVLPELEKPRWFHYAGGVAKGVFYLGLDYMFINSNIFYSYSNPDFNFLSTLETEKPFPILKKNETSVTLIGFSPQDVLYYGSRSNHFNRTEIEKYGDQHRMYDFSNSEHFINQLHQHYQTHGPIRYLKIVTHAFPGKFHTGNGSYLTLSFLQTNKDSLKKMAREVFAPDARIIFVSCLLGGNFENSMETDHGSFESTAGEDFVREFSDIFLVNGGRLDTSTRFLLGFDLLYGSALVAGTRNGLALDQKIKSNPNLLIQQNLALFPFPHQTTENDSNPISAIPNLSPRGSISLLQESQVNTPTTAVIDNTAYHLGRTIYKLPTAWWDYGVKLEGPWSQNRYRSIEVSPHD